MKNSNRRQPLGKRLILNVLFFLILPLISVAVIINILVSATLADRICRQQSAALKQCEFGLEELLKDMEYLSLVLLSNNNVQTIVDDDAEIVRTKFDLSNDIQTLLETRDYIQSICISKEDDIVFQFKDIVAKENSSYRDAVESLDGRVYWTPAYELTDRILGNGPVRVISLMREIRSLYNWKPLAIERLSIAEETLCSYYDDLYIDDGGKLFVINEDGCVISSPDKQLIGRDMSGQAYMAQIRSGEEEFFKTTIDQKRYWVFQLEIPSTGWHVIQILPNSMIRGQMGVINLYMAFSILICILFAITFYFLQKKTVVQPIIKLSDEMKQVRTGNFKLHLEVRNGDEIGDLGESFVEMVEKIDELINQIYKTELAEKEARLKTLESQIDPHFLFNTLDTIRWIVLRNGDREAAKLVSALADIFRQVLNEGREMTTIGDEISQVQKYMMIQSYRFGDRIRMETEVDQTVLDCRTIKLILQPLVENAIKHGLECKLGTGTIRLKVQKASDTICISVEDDGIGADEAVISEKMMEQEDTFTVFALKNIDRRVKLKFGLEYGLRFSSKKGVGTKVDVLIPLIRGEYGSEAVDRG
ncbi:sensor histidine kinase [Diplocloster hominis]|uniref:sensor histidine kinase n=1 Tax=Diplocloster hominis TaxID=3079010 RepID=UPI0031BAD31D